jgi:hypothetical protein
MAVYLFLLLFAEAFDGVLDSVVLETFERVCENIFDEFSGGFDDTGDSRSGIGYSRQGGRFGGGGYGGRGRGGGFGRR